LPTDHYESNEDNLVAIPEAGLYLVADGVGGRLGGEVASETVKDVFSRVFSQKHDESLRELIKDTIDFCNQKIYEEARANPDLAGMATTVALVAVEGKRAVVAHVGDSRVYRYDQHGLICLTEDHSEVGEAMRAGTITPEQAAKHPRRNVISRAIGADVEVEPDFREIEIDSHTSFILCTDGITRHITDDEIMRLMKSGTRPQMICERMKELCYAGGAEDNLTAIVVDFSQQRYIDEPTKPKLAARAVQSAEIPAPVQKKIELDLKSQAPSGPLRRTQPEPVADRSAAPAPAPGEQKPASQAAANQTTVAARRKPSLGTKELTIKVPTVRLPQKEEMSRVMKMSLLGAAAFVGILLGLFLSSPINRITGGIFSVSDPYLQRVQVRRPIDADVASAFALHLEGRSADARVRLNEILISTPRNAEAHLFLGRIDLDQKSYQDAITQMNEAARIDPNLQDVWVNLAQAYLAIGQTRNAQDCLSRALKSSSPVPDASMPDTAPSPGAESKPTPVG
jgi:protein phosphatase